MLRKSSQVGRRLLLGRLLQYTRKVKIIINYIRYSKNSPRFHPNNTPRLQHIIQRAGGGSGAIVSRLLHFRVRVSLFILLTSLQAHKLPSADRLYSSYYAPSSNFSDFMMSGQLLGRLFEYRGGLQGRTLCAVQVGHLCTSKRVFFNKQAYK